MQLAALRTWELGYTSTRGFLNCFQFDSIALVCPTNVTRKRELFKHTALSFIILACKERKRSRISRENRRNRRKIAVLLNAFQTWGWSRPRSGLSSSMNYDFWLRLSYCYSIYYKCAGHERCQSRRSFAHGRRRLLRTLNYEFLAWPNFCHVRISPSNGCVCRFRHFC